MASQKVIEAIKKALQNEEKSVKLYSDAANKTKNDVVRKTMLFLANWERSHIEKIKQLNAHIIGEMEILNVKAICSQDPYCVVKEFFDRNIDDFKKNIKGDLDDVKIYEVGMEIEKLGYNFYKKAAKEVDDEDAKQLFSWLAEEENVHFKFLQDQHSYLSDPKSWFLDLERWVVEG